MTSREEALDNIEVTHDPTEHHGMHKSMAVGRGGALANIGLQKMFHLSGEFILPRMLHALLPFHCYLLPLLGNHSMCGDKSARRPWTIYRRYFESWLEIMPLV